MRPHVVALSAGAVVLAGFAALIAWDFFQIGRTPPQSASPDTRATLIVVDKQDRRLSLVRDGQILRTYHIALGGNPVGHKLQEGDGRTPEGRYAIDFKHPRSRFHLALRISYPNADDRAHATQRSQSPGGDIMIHGQPNGLGLLGRYVLGRDWTDGCMAVTNAQMEEIWSLVDIGTPIEIRP